jgi:flagellar hook-associated protein 1 FlgK
MAMSGFNTGVSGLSAAQRALEVIGQNVANANTPGYSRQRAELTARGASTAPNFYSGQNLTMVLGVDASSITRIKDSFLEATRVNASASNQALTAQASVLSGVETSFAEPSDTGLQNTLSDMYASFQQLATSTGENNQAAAAVVIAKSNAVATQMNSMAAAVDSRWQGGYGELQGAVGQLNDAMAGLAKVNQKLTETSGSAAPINELLDQRDMLVRTIGDLAGGRASINHDNSANVTLNGITVVSGSRADTITLSGGQTLPEAGTDPPQLTVGSIKIPIDSGKTAGLMAALGGDLPQLTAQLDGVANALRDAVNTLHQSGFTLGGVPGGEFFTGNGAAGITVAVTGVEQIAMASDAGVVDGSIALAIGDLAIDSKAADILGGPGADAQYRTLAGGLGTKVSSLNRAATVQATVLANADAAVEADSGVNIDEEMASLLQYQRAYQANARVISAVDEMLDTLVNRTGV